MPSQFSAFAGGGLRFTSRTPIAESIYESLRSSWGPLFTDDPDADANIEIFAQAKALALAAETLQRAGNESNPAYCTELLPKLEQDWHTDPPPNATIQERRGLLAAAMAPLDGEFVPSLTTGLQGIIGSNLIAVVPQSMPAYGSGGVYPEPSDKTQVNGNPGKFALAGDKYKVIRLKEAIYKNFQGVTYEYVAGEVVPLLVGELLVINPLATGRTETVKVLSVPSATGYPDSTQTFYANFTKTHEPGDPCTTAARPIWNSCRRFIYVVVADAIFSDQPKMQRCNEFMRKAVGRSTQWMLVRASGTNQSGPFTIGSSIINETPIGTVTWT